MAKLLEEEIREGSVVVERDVRLDQVCAGFEVQQKPLKPRFRWSSAYGIQS